MSRQFHAFLHACAKISYRSVSTITMLCPHGTIGMLSSAWDTLKEKFNSEERCDKPSCFEGVAGRHSKTVYPPDRAQIGRANWRYVHTRAAAFPENPTEEQREKELNWVQSFVYTYPCGHCARDFVSVCHRLPPRAGSRAEYEKWWVDAHNEVNKDLSKPVHDRKNNLV